jgi:hypothetical protein
MLPKIKIERKYCEWVFSGTRKNWGKHVTNMFAVSKSYCKNLWWVCAQKSSINPIFEILSREKQQFSKFLKPLYYVAIFGKYIY